MQGMTDASCRADSVTYTCLIAAYERGGQWAPALQVRIQHSEVQMLKTH